MDETLYCPVPHTYFVAELHIQATVQNLDPQSQEASQTIKPAKCILYLYDAPRFPLPGISTLFETYIVGLSQGAEDPENWLTTDMCTPIFSNTTHPNDRPPVRTKTPFPFSNCYHWTLRGRLSPSIERGVSKLARPAARPLGRESAGKAGPFPDGRLECGRPREEAAPGHLTAAGVRPGIRRTILQQIEGPRRAAQPIVTVSVDLAAGLEEDDLPDPMEFLRQYNALVRIGRESAARRAAMEDHDSVCDDGLSVSTADTHNDQSSWTDGHGFGEMRRPSKYWPFRWENLDILTVASEFQRFSQAVMRALRIHQGEKRETGPHRELYGEENPSLSRLFDELSEIIVEPKPKHSNNFPRKMFRIIRAIFRLRQARKGLGKLGEGVIET